jgi:hypothetical protein
MIQGAVACRVPVLCDQPRLGRFTSPYRHCTPVTHHDVADALPANDDSISEIRPVAAAAHVGIPMTHVQDTGWIGAEDRVRFVQDFNAHRSSQSLQKRRYMVESATDGEHRRRQPLLRFWLCLMTPNDELAAHRDGLQLNIHPVAVFVGKGDSNTSPSRLFGALTIFIIVDDQHIVSVMHVSGMGFFGHIEISQVNRVMDSKAFQQLKL